MSAHRRWVVVTLTVLALVLVCATPAQAADAAGDVPLGEQLPWAAMAPFAAVLLAIAVMPLAAPHWWEHNRNKAIVMAVLAVPMAIYLVAAWGHEGTHQLVDKLREYFSFIVLLTALFVISGGIYVQGSFAGTPIVNTSILAIGTLLASFIGTTGASMLLIRPLLRANETRQRVVHIVIFFIFAVSNCGGLLTPLGDPPLFLGFLNGVPFEWTFRLWPQWLFVNGCLLVIFHLWDEVALNRDEAEGPESKLGELLHHPPVFIRGLRNVWFLGGVIVTIYCAGKGIGNGGERWPFGLAEGVMIALAIVSYVITPQVAHQGNRFSFGPILEVAVLFAGIFVTMTPALLILNAHGPELGLRLPWQYFWTTGILSSFLDNAPTYLTFAATAAGNADIPLTGPYLRVFLEQPAAARPDDILAAISCGAVFMGANTYIGNGPNFMVKAIAEQHNIRMPGFFAYMLYSGALLLPLFAAATMLFFR